MVLSASSYLEVYIREAVTLALRSDPFLVYGLSQQLDGVKLLKSGREMIVADHVNDCCRGTWQVRLRNFRRLFGAAPDFLEQNLKELESIRRLRNSVGHAFGRHLRPGAGDHVLAQSQRLSEERLKKWLALIEQTAMAIDNQLKSKHIGSFEIFALYHEFKDELRRGKFGHRLPPIALSKLIAETFSTHITKAFCTALIDHYDTC
ncbi:hypothetical protein [Dongia sedimenti]|uniref:RiboL-PSP-HEPN domain-containing protein n=1 Tax=Dongia sedimenti TaxID=3064282 RepID=A0ABU0YME2_9PROT|nr:hypothetical protein [Rhodospirillaceae bacterium R-7]